MQSFYREVNTGTGISQESSVFTVCEQGVIAVFVRYRAAGMALVTAVTDIRCAGEPAAVFFHEVPAMLVTAGAGSALDTAELNLVTDIGMLTVEPFRAEVVGVKEKALACVILRQTMF